METRTVWEITWDSYLQDWLPKAVDGFGPFNRRRKSNKGATGGLCRVVSFLIAIIGTPWILIHCLAFANHNVRPQNKANRIGYWIASIIALLIDGACIATTLFIWNTVESSEDTALCIMSFSLIIPLLYAGLSKLPYLFMNDPINRKLYAENAKEFKPRWELDKPEPHIQYVKYNNGVYEVLTPASTEDSTDDEEEQEEKEEIVEEFPFCQIFRLGGDKDLHIMRVEYCPDETAFIRVVSNDSYTKPYKRKVQRDKRGERFILFNNERFYLDPNKTQPRMPE